MSEAMTDAARRDPGLVVVTGATGFIGGHMCHHLVEKGIRVRGLARSQPAEAMRGVEIAIVPDLLDRDAVRRALEGASTIVHLAARVHARAEGRDDPSSECRRINIDGTSLLLEEGVAAGITGFVFASSVKAVAGQSDRMLTNETAPQPVDAYGQSKLEAERLVRVISAREGLHAPILRLPNVYGPGMKANMGILFRAVDKGIPLPFRSVANRRSFAYVANAVAAIEALMTQSAATRSTVYVSDGEDLSTPALVRHIAAGLGKRPRLVPFPPGLMTAIAGNRGLLSRFVPFNLTGDSLTAVLGSLFVDISGLRETTGYTPHISVERGMARTAEWYTTRSQVSR